MRRPAARVNRFACPCRAAPGSFYCYAKDSPNWANVETSVAVIVPFESRSNASINRLVELLAPDMERVNAAILARTGSQVTMILRR